MVKKTISNNDFKVLNINLSHDGQFIGGVFEDDINKKWVIEVYDVDSGNILYSYSTS
jgi:hypothetical protein